MGWRGWGRGVPTLPGQAELLCRGLTKGKGSMDARFGPVPAQSTGIDRLGPLGVPESL